MANRQKKTKKPKTAPAAASDAEQAVKGEPVYRRGNVLEFHRLGLVVQVMEDVVDQQRMIRVLTPSGYAELFKVEVDDFATKH